MRERREMQVTSRPMPEWLVEPQPVEDIWSALLRGVSLNPAAIAACQEGEGELTYAKPGSAPRGARRLSPPSWAEAPPWQDPGSPS